MPQDIYKDKCQFSTKWDVLWHWSFLFYLLHWWICGVWEPLFFIFVVFFFFWLEHLWSSLPPLLWSPGYRGFTDKVIVTYLSDQAVGSDGLVFKKIKSETLGYEWEHLHKWANQIPVFSSLLWVLPRSRRTSPSLMNKEPKERSPKGAFKKLNLSLPLRKTLNLFRLNLFLQRWRNSEY